MNGQVSKGPNSFKVKSPLLSDLFNSCTLTSILNFSHSCIFVLLLLFGSLLEMEFGFTLSSHFINSIVKVSSFPLQVCTFNVLAKFNLYLIYDTNLGVQCHEQALH